MKNNKYIQKYTFTLITIILFFLSCKKQNEWLNVKANKSDVVPKTIADYQALMDNSSAMTGTYSTAGLVGCDNYYLPDASFTSANELTRNLYQWSTIIWVNGASTSWNNNYKIIEISNVVIEGLNKLVDKSSTHNSVLGQAYFHRAIAYYQLCQMFTKPYIPASADQDLGVPIRLTSDVNVIAQRPALQENYRQMIDDASKAAELLPNIQPYLQRPVKAAALGLLAKIALHQEAYSLAVDYATACLNLKSELLNFNNQSLVNTSRAYRFTAFAQGNPEVIFYAEGNQFNAPTGPTTSALGIVVPELYSLYETEDLRKEFFYALTGNNAKFRGSYSGRTNVFCGIAINEIQLIRAECYARLGERGKALDDLNSLLVRRYRTGRFVPITSASAEQTLETVLRERRKELPFSSNIRWEDLRRLNKEVRFSTTFSRSLNGKTITLSPNDPRYVLPIPPVEIQLSGIQPNYR